MPGSPSSWWYRYTVDPLRNSRSVASTVAANRSSCGSISPDRPMCRVAASRSLPSSGGVRLDVGVPPLLDDFLGDLVAQRRPGLARPAAELLGEGERAIDGEPTHHLRVHVVAGVVADLPDAVIRFAPPSLHGFHHRGHQFPVAVGERVDPVRPFFCRARARSEIRSTMGPNTSNWTCWFAALPTRTGANPRIRGAKSITASGGRPVPYSV